MNLKKGDVAVDATLGGGGHSLMILKKILPGGKLFCIDRDEKAIENFKKRIENENFEKSVVLVRDNFSNIAEILERENPGGVDAVLADFGLSSDQLDDVNRGFSFRTEAPLDMRMDRKQKLTAKEVVNNYSEEKLTEIFRKFGDEKYAKRIAKKIVEKRTEKEIENNDELIKIIATTVPESYKRKKIHFATKVFQAIRMEVNKELESIEKFLRDAVKVLKSGGRLAVISFHSGEDRLVKNFFREMQKGCECPPKFPVCRCGKKSEIKIITKKPIIPSEAEIADNPRARSAKMRVIEKISLENKK